MLCCAGLIGGMAVGQYLGGPWTFVAPAAGFGLGLMADMKFMKGHHHGAHHDAPAPPKEELVQVRETGVDPGRIRQQAEPMGRA